ncbi:MAG: hypothetical protein FWE80_10030, partial [Oscillospiraceae bacterium]|nr:hypothetical protein [Oscillospiraceae bacterium]
MKKIRCVLFVVIILCALTACAENKPASPPENSGGNDVKKINPDVYRFAADAIKNKTGADLALIDSDSVNGYFDLTKATEREQLQNVLKSLQNVEKIQLTGAELLEIFEAVSSRYPEDI